MPKKDAKYKTQGCKNKGMLTWQAAIKCQSWTKARWPKIRPPSKQWCFYSAPDLTLYDCRGYQLMHIMKVVANPPARQHFWRKKIIFPWITKIILVINIFCKKNVFGLINNSLLQALYFSTYLFGQMTIQMCTVLFTIPAVL